MTHFGNGDRANNCRAGCNTPVTLLCCWVRPHWLRVCVVCFVQMKVGFVNTFIDIAVLQLAINTWGHAYFDFSIWPDWADKAVSAGAAMTTAAAACPTVAAAAATVAAALGNDTLSALADTTVSP